MSIVSAPFLFLFLPAVVGVYYLIPQKKDLRLRNVFLILASLFFYTWGEPIFILLLIGMVLLTYCFGYMAYGKKGTIIGKTAVFLTVFLNLLVMIILGKQELILNFLGNFLNKDFSSYETSFPIGFTFFAFSSISYVIDIYRGHIETKCNILQASLYTCAFFRILQGPIISYRKFEKQISSRNASFDLIGEGIWRVSIGLCKKLIIADSLSLIVKRVFSLDFASLTFGDAWLGCIAYLTYLYFDLSSYADMAIGLAKLFGFSIPENFNYPYISLSVAEFWRRWHITLCVWFTEYLYYPILLGPSIRIRKFLQNHHVPAKIAKTIQTIFVPATVWLATALWHGMNINYAIWGISNCACILIEPHINPIKNKTINTIVRRCGFFIFLFLSMPLIGISSFGDTLLFYKAMFSGVLSFSDSSVSLISNYGLYLLIGVLGCFPILPHIKQKLFALTNEKQHKIWDICAGVILFILVIISLGFLFTRNSITFLYQQ